MYRLNAFEKDITKAIIIQQKPKFSRSLFRKNYKNYV